MFDLSGAASRLLVVLLSSGVIATAQADSILPQDSIADVVARVQKGVVRIVVIHPPNKPDHNSGNQANAA